MAETKTTSKIDRVLELLRCVDLEYPDGQLLEYGPLHTWTMLCGRRQSRSSTLLSDWKRLISVFTYDASRQLFPNQTIISATRKRDCDKCCLTGLGHSVWDPLVVVPLLPTEGFQIDKELHELLGIFIVSSLLDWLLLKVASLRPGQNHWLVRRSAAATLAQGFFQFTFRQGLRYNVNISTIGGPALPSIMKKIPKHRTAHFTDPITSHVDNPDTSALQILSSRLQETQDSPKWANCFTLAFLSERGTTAVAVAWRLMPAPIRIRAYQGPRLLGAHMYGPSRSFKVQRLPFGLYLKTTLAMRHGSLANEFAALQLVRRHTSVPVASALDLELGSDHSYLLTTTVYGIPLGWCIDTLSHGEVTTLVGDLQKCLLELRVIPKEVSPKYAITNILGKAYYDGRLITGSDYDEARGDFFGPFVDEEDFNNILRCGALPNVAHFITKLNRRWLKVVDAVFEKFGNFDAELAVERQLWWYCY
ncbi:hypothetical protein E4U61_003221 [Claviceps capensis]|nr:hypothetical protein E4U61_003221 [Claviceps capensis]